MEGFMAEGRQVRTLREILQRLRETYCGSIGYEVRAALGGGGGD
jgi:2-oxoglutarate dehydrogenase E1 component